MRDHRKRRKTSGPVGGGVNPVGYCKFHRVGLTAKQMRNHECLQRHCGNFVKNKEHAFWANRQRIKEKKNERRGRS